MDRFSGKRSAIRSNTSVCLKIVDPAITSLTPDVQADFCKKLVALVEGAGFDFAHYRDAPVFASGAALPSRPGTSSC